MQSARVFVLATLVLGAGSLAAQSIDWEVRWDGGPIDADIDRVLVAVGPDGSRYAAMSVRTSLTTDLLTLAWNSAGVPLWARTRDCGGDDEPGGLVVSPLGNPVVACSADRSTDAVVTIAYDASGNELWARTESDITARQQPVVGLAIAEATGRVVVVAAAGHTALTDARIYSYATDGTPLWSRTYPMLPAVGAASLDADGNLALVGRSSDPLQAGRFMTSLLAAGGNELWSVVRDPGPSTTQEARALAVDGLGHVLVTGTTRSSPSPSQTLTVAYDHTGAELWATPIPGTATTAPASIAVDSARNVYVAGIRNDGSYSGFVHSLSPTGTLRWSATANVGPTQSSGYATVAVLEDGSIVAGGWVADVVGEFRPAASRFEAANGTPLWLREGVERGIIETLTATDDGGVFLASEVGLAFSRDLMVLQLSSAGSLGWIDDEPPVSPTDVLGTNPRSLVPAAIATGFNGRLTVTGQTFDGVSPLAATVTFDAAGNEIWEARKTNSLDFPVAAYATVIDPLNGNVYVAGNLYGPSGQIPVTIAYDRFGSELWTRTRRGDDSGSGSACCLALAPDGTVIVAGEVGSLSYGISAYVAAYSPDGNELWVDLAGPDRSAPARAQALAVADSGEIFAGGEIYAPADDLFVWALSPAGSRLWSQVRDGGKDSNDWVVALAAAPNGGVVVTGTSGTDDSGDSITLAYGSSGSELWSQLVDGGRGGHDGGSAVAVGPDGRVYVAGGSWGPGFSDLDLLLYAVDPVGDLSWLLTRDGGSHGADYGGAVSVGENGTVLVVGAAEGASDQDLWAVAYSPGGFGEFEYRYDNGGEDSGYLAVAVPGGFVVGGSSYGLGMDYFLARINDDTPLFRDGFESSGSGAWSQTVP